MRKHYPIERLGLIVALSVLVAGCQQADQTLPFELAEGQGATLTIGTNGGIISVPPSFSLSFPAGALSSSISVEVTPRISAPFPSDAGIPVPGSAFDVIVPAGTTLLIPARVEIAVDSDLLEVGAEVRMSIAVLREDGSVVTFGGTYDLTNGVLAADIDELGPIAAVISADAIALDLGTPPTLLGGSFPPPPTAPPAPSGPSLSSHGGLAFAATCAPTVRQCFTSGIIRVWADDVVRSRLGDDLFLLNPTVEADFDFLTFDQSGVPTSLVGSISIDGDLRARLNSVVTGYDIEDGVTTGPFTAPSTTTVQVTGSVMLLGSATDSSGDPVASADLDIEFGITGIGTTEMLTIRLDAEVEFENEDGSIEIGVIVAHIRLRR